MIDEYSNNEFNILISEVKECLNSSSSFDVDYFLKLLSEQEFLEIIESIYKKAIINELEAALKDED